MSKETRDVLLYGKLQDGLWIDFISRALVISRAQSYQELCVAAKNEERWLAELKRKKQYAKGEGSHNKLTKQVINSRHLDLKMMIKMRNLPATNKLGVT